MNKTRTLNRGINNIIGRYSHDQYIVNRNEKVKCTCTEHSTSQADVNCPRCLGTGYKITIRKIQAAAQDTKLPSTSFKGKSLSVTRNFFIPRKYLIQKDDIIVSYGVPFFVVEIQEMISLEGSLPYNKATTVKKQFDANIFMSNFKNIIAGKYK